jgi:hypothetical protein
MKTEQLNAEKTVLALKREMSELRKECEKDKANYTNLHNKWIYGDPKRGILPIIDRNSKIQRERFEMQDEVNKNLRNACSILEQKLEDMTDERDVYKQKYEDNMDETSNEYPEGVAEAIADAIAADNLIEMSTQTNFMDETSNEYPEGVAEAIADVIAADNLIEMITQTNFMPDVLIDDGAPGAYTPWVVTGEDDSF